MWRSLLCSSPPSPAPLQAVLVAWLALVVLFVGACTEDKPAGDVQPIDVGAPCERSSECGGGICLLSECRACVEDAACAADPAYGEGATCVSGACQPCQGEGCPGGCAAGAEGCPCDAGACEGALECREGVCAPAQPCEEGAEGCACFGNRTCLGALRCNAARICEVCAEGTEGCPCGGAGACEAGLRCGEGERCEVCPAGEQGCPCGDGGACGAPLVCMRDLCVEARCEEGAEGCPCLAEGAEAGRCEDGLTCAPSGLCAPCSPESVGCPCDDEGACGEGLRCDEGEGLCAACSPEHEGCPCDEEGECEGALVCDEEEALCRAPRACVDLGCGANQRCEEASAGVDGRCLEACLEGFVYDPQERRCVAEGELPLRCTPDAPRSLLATCAAMNRACVEDGPQGARCGACLPFYLEEQGACRAALDCAAPGCEALNRECIPRTEVSDATCGACAMGFEEINGRCEELPGANCRADGDEESILAMCQLRNELCVEVGASARCEGCREGFARDPETATCARRLCIDLSPGCEARGRACVNEPLAECGGCLPGLMPASDDPQSDCVAPVTCADRGRDPALACAEDEFCVDQEGADSICSAWPCLGPDQRPDYQRAFGGRNGNTCVSCINRCGPAGSGETGRLWPFTLANSNQCICETEVGFYYDLLELDAEPCDADQDGWVRATARSAIKSTDSALRTNARCGLRSVDRVVLENEYRQALTVKVCEEGMVAQTACDPAGDGEGCPAGSRCNPQTGLCDCTLSRVLDLFETKRNDDQPTLDLESAADLPSYSAGQRGRRLRASELNALTRACVSVSADHNDNGVRDLVEWQGEAPPGASADGVAFQQFSYFVELHEGRYEQAPGAALGRLHIREKSRCDEDFPVQYSREIDKGQWWRSCTRNRDVDYDGGGERLLIGHEFAAWGCEQQAQSCPTPPPLTDLTPAGAVPAHGLCDPGVTLPPLDGAWRGMNHASQFKCVHVVDVIDPQVDRVAEAPHLRLRTAVNELADAQGNGVYQFNRCAVACPAPANLAAAERDFSDVSDLTLNGDARRDGAALQLTGNAADEVGTAFLRRPVDFSESASFETYFALRMGPELGGGTGAIFIVQNDEGEDEALGGAAFELGYQGLGSSLGVEFDTVDNSAEEAEPDGNHVAVSVGGNLRQPLAVASPGFDLNAGLNHVWLRYSEPEERLEVFITQGEAVRPQEALLTVRLDLRSQVGRRGFFGFGAGTGGLRNRHAIERWALVTGAALDEEADLSCARDCADGACARSSERVEGDADLPRITCSPTPREALAGGEVGFAAVRYLDSPSDYIRGCIDEFYPDPGDELARPWKELCPGYARDPRSVIGQGNPGNFGELICGCGLNYGGLDCELGCPQVIREGQVESSYVHYGGDNMEDCAENNGYCVVGERGREGFWMCGSVSSVSYEGAPALEHEEGWRLRGEVPLDGVDRSALCEREGCEAGFRVH